MATISREAAKEMMKRFLPEVWRESMFLGTGSTYQIPAETVFKAIREMADPPITEEEFNQIADEVNPPPNVYRLEDENCHILMFSTDLQKVKDAASKKWPRCNFDFLDQGAEDIIIYDENEKILGTIYPPEDADQ